jgi:hypothetical protein
MHGVLSLYGLIDIAIPLSAVGMFFVLLRFAQKAKEARAAGLSSANVPFSPSRQRAIWRVCSMGIATMCLILGLIVGFPDIKTYPILEQVSLVGIALILISVCGWAFYVSLKGFDED